MGFLDRLLRRSRSNETTAGTAGVRPLAADSPFKDSSSVRRPFEIVGEAEQAWHAGQAARAEALFKQGIAGYRRDEPDGLDFALGRYGTFLIEQDREDEALRILDEAVNRKTDLPAIWSDYVRLTRTSRNQTG